MKIRVVFATLERQQQLMLELETPCSAIDAVEIALQAGLDISELNQKVELIQLGVFGERVEHDYALSDGDRLEIYRPLQQDPMQWRRKRAASQAGASGRRK